MNPPLDLTVSIWRKVENPVDFSQQDTQIYASVRAALVPISRFDQVAPYAYESTHLIWVPHWLVLRKEDQVRYGHVLPDAENDISARIFTINGRREFRMGIPQKAYYARELD